MENLRLSFPEGENRRAVLGIPFWRVPEGQLVGVRGASGMGKSSLLNVLAGMLRPDTGRVCWGGEEPFLLTERERAAWRGRRVGFVFQDFRLFSSLGALENILLPATFSSWRIPVELHNRAEALLDDMELGRGARERSVASLSRGERQRVAIARAVLQEPAILLADEPTASLDERNAARIADLLAGFAKDMGSTLIMVSHDPEVLGRAERVMELRHGALRECEREAA